MTQVNDKKGRQLIEENYKSIVDNSNKVGREIVGTGKKVRFILIVESELLRARPRGAFLEKLLPLQVVAGKLNAQMDVFTEANTARWGGTEAVSRIDLIQFDDHDKTPLSKTLNLGLGTPTEENIERYQYLPVTRIASIVQSGGEEPVVFFITKDPNIALRAIRQNYRYLLLDDGKDQGGRGSLITVDDKNLDNPYTINTFLNMTATSLDKE